MTHRVAIVRGYAGRMSRVNAERAYLFRHALLRDAAYQLQLPRDRERLHALALEAIEALAGGPGDPPRGR
ncbi:MAG: hypothetical protein HYY18_07685 [Planctomycetes bacterium]|nr:hypothetical protein [Planctomycetota bacterium]